MNKTSSSSISSNVLWQHSIVTRNLREAQGGHRGVIVWFTGLSGSGKSTLAHSVEERLFNLGCKTFVLDGDNVRHGLCGDLGFSEQDRVENIRRVGEVAKLFMQAGVIVLTAFISPFREDRARVRNLVGNGDFIEVFCDATLAVCESRDVKGLYKMARAGKIAEFTGISSPYEKPEAPDLIVETGGADLDACVNEVINLLIHHDVIKSA
ncbi:MAG: adenylyl-sulfate kinase [Gallionella sp.]|nr:adenylyl-sulfate kinase [Gallionella sp.]MDD4946170.1 adenylyl-sulfate kinase [Gallionella sp.]